MPENLDMIHPSLFSAFPLAPDFVSALRGQPEDQVAATIKSWYHTKPALYKEINEWWAQVAKSEKENRPNVFWTTSAAAKKKPELLEKIEHAELVPYEGLDDLTELIGHELQHYLDDLSKNTQLSMAEDPSRTYVTTTTEVHAFLENIVSSIRKWAAFLAHNAAHGPLSERKKYRQDLNNFAKLARSETMLDDLLNIEDTYAWNIKEAMPKLGSIEKAVLKANKENNKDNVKYIAGKLKNLFAELTKAYNNLMPSVATAAMPSTEHSYTLMLIAKKINNVIQQWKKTGNPPGFARKDAVGEYDHFYLSDVISGQSKLLEKFKKDTTNHLPLRIDLVEGVVANNEFITLNYLNLYGKHVRGYLQTRVEGYKPIMSMLGIPFFIKKQVNTSVYTQGAVIYPNSTPRDTVWNRIPDASRIELSEDLCVLDNSESSVKDKTLVKYCRLAGISCAKNKLVDGAIRDAGFGEVLRQAGYNAVKFSPRKGVEAYYVPGFDLIEPFKNDLRFSYENLMDVLNAQAKQTAVAATETSEKTYVVQWLARKIRNYARRYAQAQSWIRAAGDDPEKQETIKNHQAFLDRAYSVRLGTFLRDTANYVQDVTLVVPLWHLLGFPKAPDTTKWGEYKQPATKNIAGRSLSIAGVRTLVNLIGKLHIVLTTSPDGAVHYGEGNKSGGLHFQARGGWLFIALPINERGFEQFGGSGATVEHELEHAWDAAEYKLDNSTQLDTEYSAYIIRPSEVRARTREVLAGVVNGLNSDVMKLAANKRRLIKAGNGEKAEDKIHDMRQAMYMTWGWLGKDETIREVLFNDFGFWDANKNATLGSAILWDKFLLPLSEQARRYKSIEAKSAQEYVYQALCRLAVDIRAKYKNVTTIFDYTNKDKEGDQE